MSEDKRKKKRLLIIIVSIVAALALIGTAVAVGATRKKVSRSAEQIQESAVVDEQGGSTSGSESSAIEESDEAKEENSTNSETSEESKSESSEARSENGESSYTDPKTGESKGTEDSKQDEDSKKSEDSNKEDTKKDDSNKDEDSKKNDDSKKDDSSKNDSGKEDSKKDDSSKNDSKKDEESSKPEDKDNNSKQSEDSKPHEHTWVKGDTIAPTCEENGYTEYKCSGCGEVEKRDIIEATGHDYELRDIVEASCRTEGYYYFICKNCHEHYKANITPQLDHQFDEGKVTKEATCAEEGETTYTCELCGETKIEKIEKLVHTPGEVVIENEVATTCEKEGSYDKVIYCTVCEVELSRETVTTEALGHNFEFSETVAPTCTEDGYDVYVCPVCGETQKRNFVDALGHDYVDRVKKEATCAEEGILMHICSVCGDNYTEDIEKLPHTPGEAVIENEIPARCEEDGSYDEVVYCDVCGEELSRETKTTEATGHSYQLRDIVEATCQHEGWYMLVCSHCGDQYKANITPQLDHEYSEGVVTKEATCTEEGVITYTCLVCGDQYTESIPMVEHNMKLTYILVPSCEEEGYYLYTCSVCGYEEKRDVQPTVDHEYVVKSVTPATCEHGEITTYMCNMCGDTYEVEKGDPIDHNYVIVDSADATCEEDGYATYRCTMCEDEYILMTGKALGHVWESLGVFDGDCQTSGYELFVCKNCGEEKKVENGVYGEHSYKDKVVQPTKTEKGYTQHICSICGDEYKDNYVDEIDEYYYQYEILNQHTLVTGPIIIHIITNDPEIETLSTWADENYVILGTYIYSDITYVTDEDGNYIRNGQYGNIFKVCDGYIAREDFGSAGTHTIKIQKDGQTLETLTVTLADSTQMSEDYYSYLAFTVADQSLSSKEKLDQIEDYVTKNFIYDRNDGTYLVALVQDIGSWTEVKQIDCIDASRIMINCAKLYGLEGRYTYAGYLNHHFATITLEDGSEVIYDLGIYSRTGNIPYNMLVY